MKTLHDTEHIARLIRIWVGTAVLGLIGVQVVRLPSAIGDWSRSSIAPIQRNLNATTNNVAVAAWNVSALVAAANDKSNGIPAVLSTLNSKHGIKQLLYNVDALTAQATRTSTVVLATSRTEQKALNDTNKAMTSFLADLSHNVNDGVLPALTTDLGKVGNMVDDSRLLIASTTKTMDTAGAFVANPDWAHMLKQFSLSSDQINGSVTALHSTMVHFDMTASYVEDMFKPNKPNFWRSLAGAAVSHIAGPAIGNIVTHIIPQRTQISGPVQIKQ